jgi:diacylglycerol kinase (ATP)
MITKKLYHSFKFALCGLHYCIKNERNFRFHIVAVATVALIAPYYRFSAAKMVLIAIVISMVLICEMFNTAIEAMIDLEIKRYNLVAKRAKDISAGAVFVAALCAVICSLYLFLKIDIIHSIIFDITSSPIKIAATVIYLAISYVFIVLTPTKKLDK